MTAPNPLAHPLEQWRQQGIRPLRVSEVPQAAAVLARAFEQDPLMLRLFPRPRAAGALRRYYQVQVRALMRAGLCLAAREGGNGSKVLAVYAFLPMGRRLRFFHYLRSGGVQLLWLLGTRLLSASETQKQADKLRAKHAPNAWYVALVGVDPAAQGQGLLRRGLGPMLALTQRTGQGLYLETQNPANVPMYQHFGFELLKTLPLPDIQSQHFALFAGPHRSGKGQSVES